MAGAPRSPSDPRGPRRRGGVNFSIFSENATAVYLEIYGRPDDRDPKEVIEFREQDAFLWHSFVSGLGPGTLYGYRVDGPYEPEKGGLRFNRNKLLIDPLYQVDNVGDKVEQRPLRL